jgi:hypothetical protein
MRWTVLPLAVLLSVTAWGAEIVAGVPATTSTTVPSSDPLAFDAGLVTGKFSGYAQLWGVSNNYESPSNQGLRLRRAELKLNGTIARAPKYFLMVDPAKLIKPPGSTKPIPFSTLFQDFGLSYAFAPGLELTAGQFKIPTMAEGLDSSGELLLPERSLSGRSFGDKRELGTRLSYKAAGWNMATMLSMARPVSTEGSSELQDLITRVEVTPGKEWAGGTFVSLNKLSYDQKGRWGVNARYTGSSVVARAELGQSRDRAVQSRGLNLEAAYWITESLQPVVRFETFQPNQATAVSAKAETVGVNYFIERKHAKVQVAGSWLQEMTAGNGTPVNAKGKTDQVLTVAFQASI